MASTESCNGDEPVQHSVPSFQESGQRVSFFLRELGHMRGRILGDRELAVQANKGIDSRRLDPESLRRAPV